MSAFWAFGVMKGKGVFLLMRCTEKLRVHLFRFLTSSANRGMGKTLQVKLINNPFPHATG